jgi:hypothetical protein
MEIGDVGPRSLLQEAINSHQPAEVIAELVKLKVQQSSNDSLTVKPWRKTLIEPSSSLLTPMGPTGGTDVDLELQWIHGYNSQEYRNNVRYTAAGNIVFTAAAVGVVYSKSTG